MSLVLFWFSLLKWSQHDSIIAILYWSWCMFNIVDGQWATEVPNNE